MTPHRLVRLLDAQGILVDLCDCGEVHLHVDRTTLHLRDADVHKVLEGLSLAASQRRARPMPVMAKA